MKVRFRPEARLEVLEAREWYEARSSGLGSEFARALDAAMASAIRNPLSHRRIEGECRHVLLRKFPYSLIYLPSENELLVIACFHHRRAPNSWRNRVSG
jgi:plasmid stabilization system protein ParE